MDRITHQSPRQRGYGSTSSLRNDYLKHTRKHEKGREKSNQEAKLTGSGGPSALASRTVRQRTADYPHRYGRPSILGRGLSVKTNRTTRSEPRKTDRPRGARGLSARHPRTVRPLLRTVRNFVQPKLKNHDRSKRKASKNTKNTGRTAICGPSATSPRTVRTARTEQKTAQPGRSTPPNHHRISQTVEAVETRVWGLEKRHTRML
jgi:hypothetical protein